MRFLERVEREKSVQHLEETLESPLNFLAFVWLVLTLIDLIRGLSHVLNLLMTSIWIIFWIDFLLKLFLSPKKIPFITKNWLTLFALIVPGLRVFRTIRLLQVARLTRGSYLIRLLSSFNRGMKALKKHLGKKGFGYVVSLTVLVALTGAGGIYKLEQDVTDYFKDFGTAFWWSSMMITTMGSDYFPKSGEGRFLALLLATYGFTIFGYVTASVASFFIDRDSEDNREAQLKEMRKEIQELKDMLSSMATRKGSE